MAVKKMDEGVKYAVEDYLRIYEISKRECREERDLVRKMAGVGGRSLDIGTSTGFYPELLTYMGYEAFGLNIDPLAIDFARLKTKEGIMLVEGDAKKLPRRWKGYFDVVTLMLGTFSHFGDIGRQRVLTEVKRVLNGQNKIIISDWNLSNPRQNFLGLYKRQEDIKTLKRNNLSLGHLRTLLQENGFEVIRACYHTGGALHMIEAVKRG